MENLGILVYNRSGIKKAKRSKAELPGVWCISELKMDDVDYKVFFFFIQSPVPIAREMLASSYLK